MCNFAAIESNHKFHAVGKLRRMYWINMEILMMKCQAVIGNHYFDLTVGFHCTHFWMREFTGWSCLKLKNFAVVEADQTLFDM